MISRSEELAARSLRSVLAAVGVGDSFEDAQELADLELALERFLPYVLRDVYPREWKAEAFDGFSFAVARKTGPAEAELLGLGLLITDQSWTPVHIHLRVDPDSDRLAWVRCQVGDNAAQRRSERRLPFGSGKVGKLLSSVGERPADVEWVFSAVRE